MKISPKKKCNSIGSGHLLSMSPGVERSGDLDRFLRKNSASAAARLESERAPLSNATQMPRPPTRTRPLFENKS